MQLAQWKTLTLKMDTACFPEMLATQATSNGANTQQQNENYNKKVLLP